MYSEVVNGRIKRSDVDISTIVYGKVPPQAKDIEEVIVGAMMLDSNCVSIAMAKLFPEMFYIDAHSKIFSAIQNLYDKNTPIDIVNVIEQLKKNETLDLVGGSYAVVRLTNSVVSGANIESHILILSEMYLKRQTIFICGQAIQDAYEDESDAFDVINKVDDSMQKMQERILSGAQKDISHYGMKMIEQHAITKQTGVLGIPTGLRDLDKTICGLVSPDLIIIAARPGQGKTALALSITHNASIKGNIPCAWFSLEMDGVQLVRRLASIDSGINHESIRTGRTTKEEDVLLGNSADRISNSKIFIEDKPSVNIRDIRTRTALLKKKYKIKFIVVDYLQLMSGTDIKNKNREQIVSDISRGLKCIAKELEIPVIALSQLSRAVEARNDKMPILSDLRESGGIEQDADEVVFLMRPEYYHMTEAVRIGDKEYSVNGLTIASTAKNRHGATKNVALNFKGSTMHFTNNIQHDDFYQKPEAGWEPLNETI
jgi:replicative DNA helicase